VASPDPVGNSESTGWGIGGLGNEASKLGASAGSRRIEAGFIGVVWFWRSASA